MNINDIADQILKTNFEKLKSNEAVVQISTNPEVIHQMRVAIRRLRAAMRTCNERSINITSEIVLKLIVAFKCMYGCHIFKLNKYIIQISFFEKVFSFNNLD